MAQRRYQQERRGRRDGAITLLVDVSGSTATQHEALSHQGFMTSELQEAQRACLQLGSRLGGHSMSCVEGRFNTKNGVRPKSRVQPFGRCRDAFNFSDSADRSSAGPALSPIGVPRWGPQRCAARSLGLGDDYINRFIR